MSDTDTEDDPDAIIIDEGLLDLPTITHPLPSLTHSQTRAKGGSSTAMRPKDMRKANVAERKRKRKSKAPRYINSR